MQQFKHQHSLVPVYRWLGGFVLCMGTLGLMSGMALAQSQTPTAIAKSVYEHLPNLPLENQYIRSETNKQAVESTLVSRLIAYHVSVKGRSPLYRLDWKITLADFLGANDYIVEETYPGKAFLKSNPMQKDQAALQKLTRTERNALIQSLVDGFVGGRTASTSAAPDAKPGPAKPASASTQPKSEPRVEFPALAAPGGADALKQPPTSQPSGSSSGEAQFLRP